MKKTEEKVKTIFWAVDCQRDFMNPDGALYVKDAELIKPRLKEITEFARKEKITVVNTADCHTDKSEEIQGTPDFKTIFPPHCMLASDGIDFIEETYPKNKEDNYTMVCYTDKELHHSFDRARNIIIYKDKFDVFSNPLTEKVLERLKPEQVIVYGVATNVCVNYAVLGLHKKGYKVIVVVDAVKELPGLPVEKVYEDWWKKGILLIHSDKVKDLREEK